MEGAALLRLRIADLGLGKAVFPDQSGGEVGGSGKGEELRFGEAGLHVVEFGPERRLRRFIGGLREIVGELFLLGLELPHDPLVVEIPEGVAFRGAVVGREVRGKERDRARERGGQKEDGGGWLHW